MAAVILLGGGLGALTATTTKRLNVFIFTIGGAACGAIVDVIDYLLQTI